VLAQRDISAGATAAIPFLESTRSGQDLRSLGACRLAASNPSLHGKVNVFAGVQFKDRQPAGPGYRQQIKNAMLTSALAKTCE